MKKLTAVECLIKDLNENGFLGFYCDKSLENQKRALAFQLIDKASKLFEEQIVEANNRGFRVAKRNIAENAQDYYNETFNQSQS